MIYRFGAFELDGSQYRLSRDQTAIPVKPAVLELLLHLVEHRDRVVGKQELFSQLWSGRFVGSRSRIRAITADRLGAPNGCRALTIS